MMLEPSLTERQLITRFLDALRELPEVLADLDHSGPVGLGADRRHDAQIDLRVGGKSLVLRVYVKKAVYPRDVRQAIWQFREASHGRPKGQGKEPLSLLVAESISPAPRRCSEMRTLDTTTAAAACICPRREPTFTSTNLRPRPLQNRFDPCFPGDVHKCFTPCWSNIGTGSG